MSMQAAADERKHKLTALKKRKADVLAQPAKSSTNSDRPEIFKFRNYDPETGDVKKHASELALARSGDAEDEEPDTVERRVEGLLEKVLADEEKARAEELDLVNIQPKKPNWDLKRDLERKLTKLRSKTEISISQLIRKRLLAEKGGDAAAVELVAGFSGPGTASGGAQVVSDDEDE